MSEIDSPGNAGTIVSSIGKVPTGAQSKGEADVKLYSDVNTGKGSTTISSPFTCDLVKTIPTGKKTGGL